MSDEVRRTTIQSLNDSGHIGRQIVESGVI
jgi:hypothetical protein